MASIIDLTHPEYQASMANWKKWRLTKTGGTAFIGNYLKKFSSRETVEDFTNRKAVTYCPAFAKSSLIEIRNAIYQRITDVARLGGPDSYVKAVAGIDPAGVDLRGRNMDNFIGTIVLDELLAMGRVGVLVDSPSVSSDILTVAQAQAQAIRPYVYHYTAENILSWNYTDNQQLDALLLRESILETDDTYGLPSKTTDQFRYLTLKDGALHVQVFDASGKAKTDLTRYKIARIPFVIFELSDSLLADVADYQIALLNMESADVSYVLKSNFPFYTEQFDIRSEGSNIKGFNSPDPDNPGSTLPEPEIKVGVTTGRRYPMGTDRPEFIHPSPEPLQASMEKEAQIRSDIRILINLAISNLSPKMASAESKQIDEHSLESGLSYIGMVLEYGERQIADFWALYEGIGTEGATINYPDSYSLQSSTDRRAEAKELLSLLVSVPSEQFRKELAKKIARLLLYREVTPSVTATILAQIDASKVTISDPETIGLWVEKGLISAELASQISGIPEGEVTKARAEHVARLAAIAAAQSAAAPARTRGLDDTDPNPGASDQAEKDRSQKASDTQATPQKLVRGRGK